MDWVYCNHCLGRPSSETTFCITSCGHIFCYKCTKPSGPDSSLAPCRVCSINTKIVPINRKMSPDVQIFFRNPQELATEYHHRLNKVVDFQNKQKSIVFQKLMDKQRKTVKMAKEMQETLKQRSVVEKQLVSERNDLKSQVSRLQEALKAADNRISELQTRSQPTPTRYDKHGKHGKLSTPNAGISFANVVHSTPFDQNRATDPLALFDKPSLEAGPQKSSSNNIFHVGGEMQSPFGGVLTTPAMLGIQKCPNASQKSQRSVHEKIF